MEILLQKAIEINSTTILPNFGAFMKMGKSILFNEFLKYDDGKLVKVIVEIEKISEEDAKSKINSWIDSTIVKLDKGESINIASIGVLTKENGKIKLTPVSNSSPTSSKPAEVIKEKKVEAKPAEIEKESKVAEIKEVIKEKEVVKEIINEEIIPEVKEKTKPVSKVVNISTDFSAQDSIDKIKAFTNKNDLIAFTREDKRKTVIDALNKKLDAFNGKVANPTKEEKVEAPIIPMKVETKIEEEKSIPVNTVIEDKKEVEKTIKKEEAKVEAPATVVEKEKVIVPPIENKPEEKIVPLAKEKEVEKKEETPPVIIKKEEPKKETKPFPEKTTDEKAIAAIASSVEKTEQQLKKRKRRKLVLWLAIICLLIGGGLIGFLKKDVIMAYFDKKHEPKELADNTEEHKNEENEVEPIENEVENNTEEEVVPEVEVVVSEPIETIEVAEDPVEEVKEEIVEVVVPVVSNSSSEGNYQIVAGSFSSEENANNKVENLKSKGYSSAKVLGQYGGLYTVRAMSFSSNSEAKEALAKFKADGNKGFVKKM